MPISPSSTAPVGAVTARLMFLLLLFCGTICTAMIVPFMSYFLVRGLGYEPWIISVYAGMAISLTLVANRQFARRIDASARGCFRWLDWQRRGLCVRPERWRCCPRSGWC
ncbi:hypothetical protein L0Z66_04175 [Phaeobacter sp. BS34]